MGDIKYDNVNVTYRDDNGNVVSKEEFDRLYAKFERDYNDKYESIVKVIIQKINERCSTNSQKLKTLFGYLTSDDMKYDLVDKSPDGKRATHPGYSFPPYASGWKIAQGTKYPAILNHSGVCSSYSKTFKDICEKLGIPCEVITGSTGMDHAWNVVMENGELKHIDIAYALMNQGKIDKMNYYMKSFEEIQQICGRRTINENMSEIYEKLKPKFKIIKRSDKGFKLLNRTDDETTKRNTGR